MVNADRPAIANKAFECVIGVTNRWAVAARNCRTIGTKSRKVTTGVAFIIEGAMTPS